MKYASQVKVNHKPKISEAKVTELIEMQKQIELYNRPQVIP